jgi:hypothetical protein
MLRHMTHVFYKILEFIDKMLHTEIANKMQQWVKFIIQFFLFKIIIQCLYKA